MSPSRARVGRRAERSWAPFAATDGDLMAFEVDVLHAEGERLLEAEPGAVEQLAEEPEGRVEVVEQ